MAGRADGTYDLVELDEGEGRALPGTSVWLRARPGMEDHLSPATLRRLLVAYAGLLPTRVVLRSRGQEEQLAGRPLPWLDRTDAELRAVASELLGEDPLDVLPLALPAAGLTGLAAVLPGSPSPTARQRSRVYLKRMLLSDGLDGLLPDWAFFVRVVVDAEALQPTAARESLVQDEVLDAVRDGLGAALRTWLVGLARDDSARLQRLVRVHALALKAVAVHDPELLALFAPWLPMETTLGTMTLRELAGRSGTVRYAATTDLFSQVAQVAAAEGVCVVNAGYTYDEDLLVRLPGVLPGVAVQRVDASDLLAWSTRSTRPTGRLPTRWRSGPAPCSRRSPAESTCGCSPLPRCPVSTRRAMRRASPARSTNRAASRTASGAASSTASRLPRSGRATPSWCSTCARPWSAGWPTPPWAPSSGRPSRCCTCRRCCWGGTRCAARRRACSRRRSSV